jgi:biotin synthase
MRGRAETSSGWKKADVIEMLRASGPAREALFAEARRLRRKHFGDNVIVRGVIEITNLCRVNCSYCLMRRENTDQNHGFIMQPDQILEAVEQIKARGIDIVFLQGGEVPQTTPLVAEVIPRIQELFDGKVEILLNLGIKGREEYALLRKGGATACILKHETSDPDLHRQLREEELEARLECLGNLLDLGYKVGTGTIVGLPGQTLESLGDDVLLARDLGVHMTSASPFVPAPSTPLAQAPAGLLNRALNTIAAMRLLNPHCLIPSVSALEKVGRGGQRMGLEAGANVLTINFTPPAENREYLIYGKNRFVVHHEHVNQILLQCGLKSAKSLWISDADTPGSVPEHSGAV